MFGSRDESSLSHKNPGYIHLVHRIDGWTELHSEIVVDLARFSENHVMFQPSNPIDLMTSHGQILGDGRP